MKKLLSLMLAAALALSLTACGGNSGTGDTNTSSGGKDNAKEEMLANAPLLNISEMMQAFNENKIRAEETYLGNDFKIFGFVSEIESEYCDLSSTLGSIKFRVYLDKEELKELNSGEGINVVGTIDSFEKGKEGTWDTPPESDIININTAYYVDNTVYGVFMVETFLTDNNEKSCIAKSVQMLGGPEGGYRILFDQETVSTLNQQDFIFVGGTVYRSVKASVGPYSYSNELRDAELIVKGQDEIVEYFKQIDNELK